MRETNVHVTVHLQRVVLLLALPLIFAGIVQRNANAQFDDFFFGQLVDEGENTGYGMSMELKDGLPILAYYGRVASPQRAEVRIAEWSLAENAWQVETVAELSGLYYVPWTHKTDLVMVGGAPHIFYSGATNQLFHAYKSNGAWVNEAVTAGDGAGGGYLPAAIAVGNEFAVCFKNSSTNKLLVAEGTTGSWNITELDSIDSDTRDFCSIALKASGEPAVLYAFDDVPRFAEKSNGNWTEPVSLREKTQYAAGQTPQLIVLSNGELRAYYQYANGYPNDGTLAYQTRSGGGGAWSLPQSHGMSSQVGGYPSFIERSSGLLFGAIRSRRNSGLFGRSSSIVRYEEVEEGNPIAGINIVNGCSSVVDLSHVTTRENADGSIFVAYYDPSCQWNNEGRIVVASRMVGGNAAPGVDPTHFEVTVKDDSNNLVLGAKVELVLGGKTVSKMTGADGKVSFDASGTGDYQISAMKSGYSFDVVQDAISQSYPNLTFEIAGQAPTITLSGTVKNSSNQALGSPTLTFNKTQVVPIDPETGTFSIDVTQGMEYELTISDPEWIFMNPRTRGVVHGNTTHKFVGFPK